MKSIYRIESESYTYKYRSYMACEDQSPPDCVGTGCRYHVYRGNRKLKTFRYHSDAKAHIRKLRTK